MIQSMTGYGKNIVQLPQKKITIEIKSLNSKNLDLNVRIPAAYKEKELAIRKNLSKYLVRGKVEFSIYVEVTGEETTTTINKAVVNNYIDQLREIAVTTADNTLEIAMRLPDALKVEKEELDDKEWQYENRFEQELMYYLEKLDITEEKVRLNNHLDYFLQELGGNDSNGKKLGFISQEIGREINTLGSKSNYAPMQKVVVQMKDELEKIKEQLLNVL